LARGTVRVALGKHAAGIADLQKALQMAGEPGDYLEPLAYAQLAANDQAAAIETFSRAIQDEPDSSPAWMGRGLAYYQVGQNEKAIADLSRAIELNPKHAFPRKYLGALYHDLGKLDVARQQLDMAVDLDSHDTFARKARGRLLFAQGDYPTALDDFAIAVKIDPTDIEAITGRGVVRHAIGNDLAGAEADFARAIELGDDSVENAFLWSNLGQVQMELGKQAESLGNLDRAIEIDPAFAEARSHRAYLLATMGATEGASIERARRDVIAAFATAEPKTFWDYRALGAVNAALGDFERAVRFQVRAEALVRQTGPARFVQRAVAARAAYEQRKNQ